MKPAAFTYHAPRSLEEVFDLLAAHGEDAKILAGGQSLGPMMNLRLAQPGHVIDLNGIAGLDFIREENGALAIGALARHRAVETSPLVAEACPILARAAATVGHYVIRHRGTMGGSLAHADPAAQFPLIAVLLGAEVTLASPRGTRKIPAGEFFVSILTTAIAADEVITKVCFPARAAGEGWGFRMLSRRVGDFAIVAAAATVTLHAGRVAKLRLALGGVEDRPVALTELASELTGAEPDAAWLARAASGTASGIEPQDDPKVPAVYRRELAEVLTRRALEDCLGTANEG
ncbi:MAG: FAD binding domain-containing protein [Kiloniellaceae bacterium]